MPISRQVAHFIAIAKLKGISGLDEIRFDEKPLTAVMGPNGCGKSTILHALACCYQPVPHQEDFRFPHFFTPTTDATWAGSSLTLDYSYRDGAEEFSNIRTLYKKAADRWVPRYDTRPVRHVSFINIKTCVPAIENETVTSIIRYATTIHPSNELIREKMATVFNRNYAELNVHNSSYGRRYEGLAIDGIRYSSLAMGAGEQRVLKILLNVFNSPSYGLILIDEIDLLLHTAALKSLLRILSERALQRHLQIVFTTHREAVLELTELISIKHIHTVAGKTYCFSNTKPDAIHRLTGTRQLALEIFVEDELTLAIVEAELFRAQLKKFAAITVYGAATNCFTLASGLLLNGSFNSGNQLFLQDGDVYATNEERQQRINKSLSGTEENIAERRAQILGAFRKLCPITGVDQSPEAQLHYMIRNLPPQGDGEMDEIIGIAQQIQAVHDNHDFVKKILHDLNISASQGLLQIARVASRSDQWIEYVAELREWIEMKRAAVIEQN
jgi:Fe-S cluster assembly ATPase SufC